MTISATGSNKTGSTDSVTLSSPGNGLGAPYPPQTSSVSFSGSLPVTGAQTTSIPLSRSTTHVTESVFRVVGHLLLTHRGTDHIFLPQQFTFTLTGPRNTIPIVFKCSLKGRPGPAAGVGLVLMAIRRRKAQQPAG
jgi:hypothetical protein